MKKMIAFVLGLAMALSLAACGQPGASASQAVPSDPTEETEAVSTAPVETQDIATPVPEQQSADVPEDGAGKTLVVYFSATGSTERVAGYIASATKADQFELIPAEPYTSADLSWTTEGSRVNLEHDDESLRDVKLAANTVDNWGDYDTIFVG